MGSVVMVSCRHLTDRPGWVVFGFGLWITIILSALGCGKSGSASSGDVTVRKETYYYGVDSTSRREYDEVQFNKVVTMRVPRAIYYQQLFSHKPYTPLLVSSKKPVHKIHISYQSGSGELLSQKVSVFRGLGDDHWRRERQVDIDFVDGMNSAALVFFDGRDRVLGVFYIKDCVDRLIDQNILDEKYREQYLGFKKS